MTKSRNVESTSLDERPPAAKQESLCTAISLVTDKDTRQLVELVDPALFDTPFDEIVSQSLAYWKKYKRAPGKEHIDDVFAYILEKKDHKLHKSVDRIINGMLRQAHGVNTNFLLDEWEEFARHRMIRAKAYQIVEHYQANRDDDAIRVMSEAAEQVGRAGKDGLVTVKASDVSMQPLMWLWNGFIPFRLITLVVGLPKEGKSSAALSLVATATTGRQWPDGTRFRDRLDALVISGEDNIDDTIVPRLKAMGADLDRVEIVKMVIHKGQQDTFSIQRDLPLLERKLKKNRDLGLIIIDPVAAYLGGNADGFVETQVRRILAPLRELAAKYDVAVIGIMHFKKGSEGSVLYQVAGSIAFTATARAIFACVKDKDDPERRLFLPVGANNSKSDSGFAYRIESATFKTDEGFRIETQKIKWEDRIEGTADDVLGGNEKPQRKTDIAAAWLRGRLAGATASREELRREAEGFKDAFSWKSVERAAEKIVQIDRKGFGEGSIWSLKK